MIVIVLGNGEREYEDMFRRLNKQYPQKFAVKIDYDNAAGAQDRGRRRHVPDAVELRALRSEPDLQPAIRHGAQ